VWVVRRQRRRQRRSRSQSVLCSGDVEGEAGAMLAAPLADEPRIVTRSMLKESTFVKSNGGYSPFDPYERVSIRCNHPQSTEFKHTKKKKQKKTTQNKHKKKPKKMPW